MDRDRQLRPHRHLHPGRQRVPDRRHRHRGRDHPLRLRQRRPDHPGHHPGGPRHRLHLRRRRPRHLDGADRHRRDRPHLDLPVLGRPRRRGHHHRHRPAVPQDRLHLRRAGPRQQGHRRARPQPVQDLRREQQRRHRRRRHGHRHRNTSSFGWDSDDNPTSEQLPTGATASLSYQSVAGADLPGTLTDPDGDKTSYTYDSTGNTLTVATSGTDGGTTTFTYNGTSPTCGGFQGQKCSEKDPAGRTTTFHYDSQGNLTKVTPPSPQGPTTYTYDALGRPATATDGRGTEVLYTYDARDRVTKTDTANYSTTTYTYDGDGNLTRQTDPNGTTSYTFDALGRETLRTLPDATQTQLAYNADGSVHTYTDPTGTTTYGYDNDDNLTSLTDPTGATTSYSYNDDNTRTTTSYPGGTTATVTVDNSQRPTEIKATSSHGTLEDLSYTYSYTPSGSTTAKDGDKIRTVTDHTTSDKTTYTYDTQGRLNHATQANGSTTVHSWQYCFNTAGDITSQGSGSSCPAATTDSYDATGQLTGQNSTTTGWSYDKAGDETAAAPAGQNARTSEQYGPYDQLTSITTGATTYTAAYTGTGTAVRTKLGSTTFRNGPLGLAAQTTAGVTTGFVREPSGTLNSVTTAGKSDYYLTDAIGDVVGLVDNTGTEVDTYSYSPYGTSTSSTQNVPQPYQYAGAYLDPTGLYHMGARYYDPTTGRFTQTDPASSGNLYQYGNGDPIDNTDPTGMFSWGTALKWAGVGAAIGSAFATGGLSVALGAAAIGLDVGSGVADDESPSTIAVSAGVDALALPLGGAEGAGYAASTALKGGYAIGNIVFNSYFND